MSLTKLLSLIFVLFNSSYSADLIVNLTAQNTKFVGRKELLNTLSVETSKNGSVMLLGSGGIGKSQLAKQYAWVNQSDYDFIWWVNAGQPIESQALDFAKQWNAVKTDSQIQLSQNVSMVWDNVVKTLSQSKKTGLVVFDNFIDLTGITHNIKQLMLNAPHHKIVSTTRNMHSGKHFNQVNPINEFTRNESIELLTQISRQQYNNNDELHKLAALLKDYPLSIAQACAYLNSISFIKVEDYIQGYQKRRHDLSRANYAVVQGVGKALMDGYVLTTEITVSMVLDQIKKESHDAYYLAEMLSFIDHENIPEAVILKCFNDDKIKSSEAIAKLMQYAFLEKKTTQQGNLYVVHEVISEIVRSKIDEKHSKFILLKLSSVFNQVIPSYLDVSNTLFLQQYYYLNHIQKIFSHALKFKAFSGDLIDIKIRSLEYFVTEKRDKQQSYQFIVDISDILHQTKKVEYLSKARFMLIKSAFSAYILNDLDQAILEATEAEKNLNEAKGVRSEEWMMLYLRLAQSYILQGDYANTLKYTNLAEELIHRDGNIRNHVIAVIYQAKAVALLDKGDFKQAHLYIDKAISHSPPEEENKIMIIGFLVYKARLLSQEGKAKVALSLADQVEEKVNKYLPHKNYFSSAPFSMRAECFYHLGKYDEAENNVQKAITSMVSIYPENTKGHRRLAYAYMIAGNIAYQLGKKQAAINYYVKAEKMYKSSLKHQKIKEISDLYLFMSKAYFDTQEHFLAAEYRDKHESLFGIDDENSLEINLYLNKRN